MPPVDPRPDATNSSNPTWRPHGKQGAPGRRLSRVGHFVKTRSIFRNLTSQEIRVLPGVLETRGSCSPTPFLLCLGNPKSRPRICPASPSVQLQSQCRLRARGARPPRPRCPPRGCCRANAAGEKPESLQHAVMETVGQGPTQCGHSWSPLEGSLQDSGGRLCPERLPVASCLVPSSPAAAKGYWAPPAGHQEHVLQDEDRKLPGTTDTQRFAKRQCWDAGGQC